MPVHKYLDLSTGHVTAEEMMALDRQAETSTDGRAIDCLPIAVTHHYGVWLHVPDERDDEIEPLRRRHFPNVTALIEHARKLDCNWINIDADAEYEEGLPRFDW